MLVYIRQSTSLDAVRIIVLKKYLGFFFINTSEIPLIILKSYKLS
jgi:hypothetical protein